MANLDTPLLIKFSENRRTSVLESISNEQRTQLRKETFSKFLFSFVPNFVSCTLFFPLLKMRILSQTEYLVNSNSIQKPNSLKYWYKGSFIQSYLLVSKSLTNAVVIERYQHLRKNNSSEGMISNISKNIYYCGLASLLSGIMTYPFELSLTRACVLDDFNLKKPKDYLNLKEHSIPIKLVRYYESFFFYFLENTFNGFALLTFYTVYNKVNRDKYLSKYFMSFIAALSASVISYPLNTITKYAQVGGIPNYKIFLLKEVQKQLLYK